MWPFDSDCDHEWTEFETEMAFRGDFDKETGEFEWIASREIGERCARCSEERNVETEKRTFKYEPDEVIEHET